MAAELHEMARSGEVGQKCASVKFSLLLHGQRKSQCWYGETPLIIVAGDDFWGPMVGKNSGNKFRKLKNVTTEGIKMKKAELLSLK